MERPTVMPKLAPFWFELPFQEDAETKVEFYLRPLTQADMIEVEDHFDAEGRPTRRARYEAGLKAIVRCRGIKDEEGGDAVWTAVRDRCDRALVVLAGSRALVEASNGDWDAYLSSLRGAVSDLMAQYGVEEPGLPEPIEAEDHSKN